MALAIVRDRGGVAKEERRGRQGTFFDNFVTDLGVPGRP